ncbi:MAG: sugar phosphate nucleotidyltransferase [Bryobacteraceae bacterium]
MKITKAVITAAAPMQRRLPLQTLVDRDGTEKSVLAIQIAEACRARIEEICIVVFPGDEAEYAEVAGDHAARLTFVPQPQPLGYAHAVYCARQFVGQDPFLHLVGDHLWVSQTEPGCAQQLVEAASAQGCAVSAVMATRENRLPSFGAVGGQRVPGHSDLYRIQLVLEKPTPTEAEQHLIVPGLRAGYYLCFFGMHVLTPTIMAILDQHQSSGTWADAGFSAALSELARREQYLALEQPNRRYDLGSRYGILTAQLALALSGPDRDDVLSELLALLATREMASPGR